MAKGVRNRRKFRDDYYYYSTFRRTKSEAKKTADNLRKRGFLVRVIKEKKGGRIIYGIFKRKK